MNGMKAFGALKSCTGCLLLFMACSISMMQSAASPTPSATAQGTIYAASPAGPSGASAIFRLNSPSSLNGNVVPSATITGPLTLLDSPVISLDASADRLFAFVKTDPIEGEILVFDHASTRNGNIFPDRIIAGRTTGIQGTGVFAVDGTRNLLYAGTRVTSNGVNILVFKNAAAATGNVPPDAVLQFSTSPTFPVSMVLDQVNDRLFIGDRSQDIQVFDHASMLTSGPMVPDRTISDPNNILSGGMALDSAGRLLVSSRKGTNPAHISIYANAATANGVVSPVAIITGPATALNIGGPGALAIFNGPGASAGGDLYVSVESGKVLVFTNIATANGDMKPARTICISTQASGLSLAADGSH